ncbi:alpha/beta fold hydrolase [Xylophilus sp. GOD-11R]|uniref:alpha/beta fold hydrolase n=1 Tax=Xylophilus sp. GOD-11R TaxID=3089814 RepID=UPI00298C9020|nr:alpha/beta fold hydrolase [Xylophilus sp. GOD-11R]WPB56722.1 alpha/beta fold hydrolase [Xylophilus sp. GOD-11R]
MPRIIANGIPHSYQLHGDESSVSTPVALVAGMGGAGSFWTPQLPAISRHWKTLVYDQRGTGGTEQSAVRDIEQLADDFVALLDALKIPSVHFVGHSTGGAIGMSVAVRYPDRVRSLVLYASVHRADAYRRRVWGLRKKILQEMGPEVYAQTTSLFFYPPEYVAAHSHMLEAVEARSAAGEISAPEIMASRIDSILAFDIAHELPKIHKPTLVLCARDDMLTPAYFSEEIAALIPGATLRLYDRGGHAFSRSRQTEFDAAVVEFVASCEEATA